ncbi:MAG: NIPSNAP family protein [Haliea sp.]|nr:MAG: NIPSNAP family protein [Haliea sp.]
MIIEERIYVMYAEASQAEFLHLYETEALVVQRPILGGFLGYFTSEFGQLNQLVHWWAYRDLEDRRVRRERLAADPQWQAALPRLRTMLQSMDNRILVPTSFSPIQRLPVALGEPHTALSAPWPTAGA